MANPEATNRFQKHDEARQARHQKAADSVSAREAVRQSQREKWTGSNRSGGAGVGVAGTRLDAKTVAARDAERARRTAAKAAAIEAAAPRVERVGDLEGEAIARAWTAEHPEWHGSEYNAATLAAIIEAYQLPTSFAGLTSAFEFGVSHNHFEPARRHRGQPAPVPFAPTQRETPEQPQVKVIAPTRIQKDIPADEYHELQSIPLDELKKRARSGMTAYNQNAKRGE
jgi:hypothetical protein